MCDGIVNNGTRKVENNLVKEWPENQVGEIATSCDTCGRQ